mmetsp:Transcript_57738/g.162852  ORF Transcript_57738/g.162852 Transcript_57738/m.162852 type:complete len:227 (-) Transcript_57738:8-688(-)
MTAWHSRVLAAARRCGDKEGAARWQSLVRRRPCLVVGAAPCRYSLEGSFVEQDKQEPCFVSEACLLIFGVRATSPQFTQAWPSSISFTSSTMSSSLYRPQRRMRSQNLLYSSREMVPPMSSSVWPNIFSTDSLAKTPFWKYFTASSLVTLPSMSSSILLKSSSMNFCDSGLKVFLRTALAAAPIELPPASRQPRLSAMCRRPVVLRPPPPPASGLGLGALAWRAEA